MSATEEIFCFTRGRFICNEAFEMAQRYVKFDMNELSRLAAQAVGAKWCSKVEKYPDGFYNKIYLFTMNDGSEVVGKVPNHNAGRPHFTTASEVATMDFMRTVLKTPVPRVFTWSSNAQNPIGAEYILMEKAAGIQLRYVWPPMDIKARLPVVKALARYQKLWSSTTFRGIGSLYYAEDMRGCKAVPCVYTNGKGEQIQDSRYMIGPCTGRKFSDDGRSVVSFDRGPWTSVEAYGSAVGFRELACIKELPRLPSSPLRLHGPGVYRPSRQKKIAALEYYLKLIDYLLPTDESIKASCLWHSDFHDENIYVNPDNHAEIVGIIDWQNTDILPLFDHARQPPILDYDGPEVKGLERPELDKDVNKRTPDERRRALALFHDQTLVALYRMLIHGTNKVLWRAMEFLETPASDMLRFAQVLLVDGEAVYLARLTDFESDWADLPKVRAQGNPPFPLQFTLKEVMAIEHDLVASQHGMRLMDSVKANVGDLFPEKGIVVNHDQYEDSKNALRQVKLELYEQLGLDDEEKAEWDSSWPFDDVPTLVHGLIDQQGDLKP